MTLDYVRHLEQECDRFEAALRSADPSAPVPSCPQWTADDLMWHLGGEAFYFWAAVLEVREYDALDAYPDSVRPPDHAGVLEFWRRSRVAMTGGLAAVGDDEPMWTWSPDPGDQRAAFVKRRMAHEALIHRVDAELTAGARTGIDAALAADGVDEALRKFFARPDRFDSWDGGPAGRLRCSDTGHEWLVQVGTYSGRNRVGEPAEHAPALALDEAGTGPTFTVEATAADLDLWMWNRQPGEVRVSGSQDDAARLAAMISVGVG